MAAADIRVASRKATFCVKVDESQTLHASGYVDCRQRDGRRILRELLDGCLGARLNILSWMLTSHCQRLCKCCGMIGSLPVHKGGLTTH